MGGQFARGERFPTATPKTLRLHPPGKFLPASLRHRAMNVPDESQPTFLNSQNSDPQMADIANHVA